MDYLTSFAKSFLGSSAPSDSVIRTVAGVGASLAVLYAIRRFCAGPANKAKPDLTGRFAIVTGGNCGIGLETVAELAKLGATVIMASRDSRKTREAVTVARHQSGSSLINASYIDLNDLDSVRAFVQRYIDSGNPLHLLINNAGIMALPTRQETAQGFEAQFGVNHIGHYLLTRLLLPVLETSAPARIINVSSDMHFFGGIDFDDLNWKKRPYSPTLAYGQSKGANIAFTADLARRLEGTGITVYSLHPGSVDTDLLRYAKKAATWLRVVAFLTYPIQKLLFKSPWEGAQTTLYCALAPLSRLQNGGHFADCRKGQIFQQEILKPEVGERLWKESAKLIGMKD